MSQLFFFFPPRALVVILTIADMDHVLRALFRLSCFGLRTGLVDAAAFLLGGGGKGIQKSDAHGYGSKGLKILRLAPTRLVTALRLRIAVVTSRDCAGARVGCDTLELPFCPHATPYMPQGLLKKKKERKKERKKEIIKKRNEKNGGSTV